MPCTLPIKIKQYRVKMSPLKRITFVVLLLVHGNSHGETPPSASVMDVLDRYEDTYLLLSNKAKAFLCGHGNQKMDIHVRKFVKFLLCGGRETGEDTLSEQTSRNFDFDFSIIKPNSFMMGSVQTREPDERQVEVTISRPFEIMKREVTQIQWFDVMGDNPSHFSKKEYCEDDHIVREDVGLCPHHPVDSVSWKRTRDFIHELNRNLKDCDGTPDSASGCYRLPTEAEWEFAARAGSEDAWYFGGDSDQLQYHAWYSRNSNRQTHRVGGKAPNNNGLYDIYGNVWEWVRDGYKSRLPGGIDPLVDTDPVRIIRGGGWGSHAANVRSAYRFSSKSHGTYVVGVRLARTL